MLVGPALSPLRLDEPSSTPVIGDVFSPVRVFSHVRQLIVHHDSDLSIVCL